MRIRKDIASLVLLCILVAVNYLYLIPVQVVEEGSDPVYPLLLNGILAFLLIFYALELLRSRYGRYIPAGLAKSFCCWRWSGAGRRP